MNHQVFPIIPAASTSLWIASGLGLIFFALVLLMIYIAFASQRVTFTISESELQIRGDLYGRTVPIDDFDLDKARVIDLNQSREYQPRLRTNGIGLPGYRSGWFRLRNKEKALLFVTTKSHVVFLPTHKGYSLMISPADPELFLSALHK